MLRAAAAIPLAPLAAACLNGRTAAARGPDTAGDVSKLVVEDASGAIVGWVDLAGRADASTIRKSSPGGVQVVRAIARQMRAQVKAGLDALLAGAALERMPLRRALREGRITCHAAYYAPSDGEFGGVGGLECRDALVYRTSDDGRPLEEQIGLLGPGTRTPAGTIRDLTERRGASRKHDAGDESAGEVEPEPVTWEDLLPTLEALVLVEREADGATALRICSGVNRLERLDPEKRNTVVEQAVVRALIRLAKDSRGVPLIRRYVDDDDFPRRVFQDGEVRLRLAPLLREELRRLGVASAL